MPEDNVDLHRLIWSPDDYDGEQLLTSAFRKQDLSGKQDDYVSVSRVDKINPDAEIKIANDQAQKAGIGEIKREIACSVVLNCGEVRSEECSKGKNPFEVTDEPIPNENEAHCGIRNISGENGKGYINELRTILVRLAKDSKKVTLKDFIQSFGK